MTIKKNYIFRLTVDRVKPLLDLHRLSLCARDDIMIQILLFSFFGVLFLTWGFVGTRAWAWTRALDYFIDSYFLFIAGYIKIFGHNTAGGLFSSTTDAMSKNPENPNAYLFSILNNLENYRGKDGNFQFKLCYPEVGKCNEWIQSSNPATETIIKGFKAISLEFTKNGIYDAWAGLGKASSFKSKSYGTTLIDDAPESKNWFCAIGATAYWPEKLQIPGPNFGNSDPEGISEVVLYVFK